MIKFKDIKNGVWISKEAEHIYWGWKPIKAQ